MLCEVSGYLGLGAGSVTGLLATWAALSLTGLVSVVLFSSLIFYYYYWPSKVTFEKWQLKSNPQFPSPEKIRDELVQTVKSIVFGTLCPAIAIVLAAGHGAEEAPTGALAPLLGLSKGYCGPAPAEAAAFAGGSQWAYLLVTFLATWLVSDFFEFFYHRCGHKFAAMWEHHKSHHVFFNPSPFAVIADEFVDQFVRSTPLLAFPLLFPVNMDMLFAEYAVFFYAYGVYLHWGYEVEWLSPHNPFVNTSFQHYAHHAVSIIHKPLHTGFMIKLWDQLFGSVYTGECFCAHCERAAGKRSMKEFKKVQIPDYTVLLEPSFWYHGGVQALTGLSAKDENVVLTKFPTGKGAQKGRKASKSTPVRRRSVRAAAA